MSISYQSYKLFDALKASRRPISLRGISNCTLFISSDQYRAVLEFEKKNPHLFIDAVVPCDGASSSEMMAYQMAALQWVISKHHMEENCEVTGLEYRKTIDVTYCTKV